MAEDTADSEAEAPSAEPEPEPGPEVTPDAAADPGALPQAAELSAGSSEPAASADAPADGEDLSTLLVSDEPERAAPRVRVASSAKPRVDRSERMRNYYGTIYRPAHNPSRLYFAARGAYALSGTGQGVGGGRMGFVNAELGQTWNYVGYAIGPTVYAGSLTFGENGVEKYGGLLIGGGPSLGLGRLTLLGRGYFDARIGYNFFYAPISATRAGMADPPDAAPHGPKVQIDVGLLMHNSESRRFRHGIGASLGWMILVHSFAGDYPIVNTFNVGVSYFFG